MKASSVVILLLLIAVGVLAYGWGRDSAQAKAYKEQARAAQAALDGLRLRYDSAGAVIEGLTKAMEARGQERKELTDRAKSEPERLRNEQASIDTAGALTLRGILLWTNDH